MSSERISVKTVHGVFWNAASQFSGQIITFVVMIPLARILGPSEFGIVAMLDIFLVFANLLIDGGFGKALLHKQNRTEDDFATVFYFNALLGVFCYLILFFSSPLIALFFKTPVLVNVTRVMALVVISHALCIVQWTKIYITFDYKTKTIVLFISQTVSNAIAIIMAVYGYGVWSLAVRSVLNSALQTFLLFVFIRWIPPLRFSRASFKSFFSFGSKLLLANFIAQSVTMIASSLVGRRFAGESLGYYERARQFSQMPVTFFRAAFQDVVTTLFYNTQSDNKRIYEAYAQYIRITAFVLFPIMFVTAALAKPFIVSLLSAKWTPSALLLQLFCIMQIVFFVPSFCQIILETKGRTDLSLKLMAVQIYIIYVPALIIGSHFGMTVMLILSIAAGILIFFMYAYTMGRLIGFGLFRHISHLAPIALSSFISAFAAYTASRIFHSDPARLAVGVPTGIIAYLLANKMLGIKELSLFMNSFFPLVKERLGI